MSITTPLLIRQLPFFVADLILWINGQNVDKLTLTGKWLVVGRIISSQNYCQRFLKSSRHVLCRVFVVLDYHCKLN